MGRLEVTSTWDTNFFMELVKTKKDQAQIIDTKLEEHCCRKTFISSINWTQTRINRMRASYIILAQHVIVVQNILCGYSNSVRKGILFCG